MNCTVALSIVGVAGVLFALGGFYVAHIQAKWMASFYTEQIKDKSNERKD